ncbi:MAG TPA: DMT family transporter [Alphaproteobacteria bacterium]|nr:DMT family transporter [Alphaproteobacteria bacterium]
MIAANLGLLLTMLIWGAFIPALNLAFDRWDPWSLAAIRYWIALPLLALLMRLGRSGPLFPVGINWRRVALVGGLGFGGFGGFYTLGVAHTNPITAAILSAAGPVIAAVVVHFGYGGRLAPGTRPALVLAFAGGMLAMVNWRATGNPLVFQGGEILLLLAALCWCWYSVEAQRSLAGMTQMQITFLTMIPASIVLTLAYLAAGFLGVAHLPMPRPSGTDLLIFLYMGGAVAAVGVMMWNFGVQRLGVVVASIYLNLIPVVAVAISVALGTPLRIEQLVGGILVLSAVALSQLASLAELRQREPG